ncbi:MAG: putative inorganic carbon transporter subunit DabA, partial [bacterium]
MQPWRRRLRARLDALGGLDVEALALGLLRDAGLDGAIGPAVEQTLLALRGWGGMFARAEERPDLMPERAVPARLAELLAVRLLLDEAAAHHVLDGMGVADGTLAQRLAALPAPRPARAPDRAWTLFQLMRLAGAGPETLPTPGLPAALLAVADALPAARRGLLLQLALERSYRDHLLDAVAGWGGDLDPDPRLQLIACIDAREESLRRHLEEQDPGVETFGAAGFFG